MKSVDIFQLSKSLPHFPSSTPVHRFLRRRQESLASAFPSADADNITCSSPAGLRARAVPAVAAQLRFSCLTQLYEHDYIFLCLIGFGIFFAGTVAAWLAGICAVIYEVHTSKAEEEEEEEDTVT